MNTEISKRLEQVFKATNTNSNRLAKALGLARSTVSRIENGITVEPGKNFSIPLEEKFGISSKWFYYGEGDMFLKKETDDLSELRDQVKSLEEKNAELTAMLAELNQVIKEKDNRIEFSETIIKSLINKPSQEKVVNFHDLVAKGPFELSETECIVKELVPNYTDETIYSTCIVKPLHAAPGDERGYEVA